MRWKPVCVPTGLTAVGLLFFALMWKSQKIHELQEQLKWTEEQLKRTEETAQASHIHDLQPVLKYQNQIRALQERLTRTERAAHILRKELSSKSEEMLRTAQHPGSSPALGTPPTTTPMVTGLSDCHNFDDCNRSAYLTLDLHRLFKVPQQAIFKYCSAGLSQSPDKRATMLQLIVEALSAQGETAVTNTTSLHSLSLSLPQLRSTLEAVVASPKVEGHRHARKLSIHSLRTYVAKHMTLQKLAEALSSGYCVDFDFRMTDLVHRLVGNASCPRNSSDCWRTYNTFERVATLDGGNRVERQNADLDALMALFEFTWESHTNHAKTYWLGVQFQQHPVDALVLQDIIYRQQPDLILETGTNNGGAALYYASIMELAGNAEGRVVTCDPNDPATGGYFRSGTDPKKVALWEKRVQFVQGLSTRPNVMEKMEAAVARAKRVMVILDSNHLRHTVEKARQ